MGQKARRKQTPPNSERVQACLMQLDGMIANTVKAFNGGWNVASGPEVLFDMMVCYRSMIVVVNRHGLQSEVDDEIRRYSQTGGAP
jgi:hypothetical protein